MADSYVQVAVDSSGKKIQNFQNTIGANVVYAQAVTLVDSLGAPITVDPGGDLGMHMHQPLTAFGEISAAHISPVVQIDFVYGINTHVTGQSVTGSGTVTNGAQLMNANTTANASSSATVYSKRYAKYRAGMGVLSRFTALFTAGAAGSKQYAGAGTPALAEGFFFGFNGTEFGICHTRASTDTWTAQASWNVDNMLGGGGATNKSNMTLVPTYGNVYQIKTQYLGFGCIQFFIESPTTAAFVLVHVLRYANANTVTNINQPSLNIVWKAINAGNTTAITVKAASAAMFIEGIRAHLGPRFAYDSAKNSITTMTNLLTLRNATSYNGVANRAQVRIRSLSFGGNTASKSAAMVTLRVYLNATLGGSPSFACIDGATADQGVTVSSGNAVTSVDVAGTTVSGGTLLYACVTPLDTGETPNIGDMDFFLGPSDTATFAVSSGAAATVGVAVSWSEDL